MEGNDYLSTTSGGGGAPLPVMPQGNLGAPVLMGTTGLRPTTAAAVAGAGGGGGMESDMLLGNATPDDLDVDYEMRQTGNDRPNTAGAMYNRNTNTGGIAQAQGASWGYSRQGDPAAANAGMVKGASGPILGAGGGGMVDYGTEGVNTGGQRRPHTAHGGRAAIPSSSQQQLPVGMYEGEEVC